VSTLDVGRLRAWLEIDKTQFDKTLREFEREMRDAEKDAAKRLDAIAASFEAMDRQAADSGEDVGRSVKKMAASVEDADRRVRLAHEAVAEAAEEMARAHTELEFRRLAGEADALAAAEKRLDRALREVAKSGREADDAMASLGRSQSTAAVENDAETAGSRIGDKLGQGVRKAATSAITYAIPAIAAGGIQLGAAAGGGVVTGFGAGIIGLGIMAQKGNEQVEASFVGMSSRVAKRAQDVSKPWIGTLIQISHVAEQTWHTLEDELEGALARLAPATGRFVTNTAKAVAQFGPALDPISRATEAVMDDLGGRLPRIVDGLADSLADLADSVERNPEALGDLVEGIGNVLEVGIELLDFLVEAKGKFDDLNPAVKTMLAPWTALDDAWNAVNGTGDEVLTTLDAVGSASRDAGAETEALKKAQDDAARAAKDHADALDDLADQVDDLIGTNIDARKAMNDAKDDVAEYAKAVKEHGVTSQQAAEAQLNLEDSAFRAADAIRNEVLAQQAAAGQSRDMAGATAAARDRLRELAAMTSGPARDALLNQANLLEQNLAALRAMDRQFNARVNIHVSQTGKAAPGLILPSMRAFARGGSIGPGEIGRVSEEGPEMLTEGGKHYLLNGAKPGYITPTPALAMGKATGSSGGGLAPGQLVVKVIMPPPSGDPVVDALMAGMRDRIRVSYEGSAQSGLGTS
jgi:hypothetical protein